MRLVIAAIVGSVLGGVLGIGVVAAFVARKGGK